MAEADFFAGKETEDLLEELLGQAFKGFKADIENIKEVAEQKGVRFELHIICKDGPRRFDETFPQQMAPYFLMIKDKGDC